MEASGEKQDEGEASSLAKEEKKDEGPDAAPKCSIPTINFSDFVSLLSPNSLGQCLCCGAALLTHGPPSLFPQRKTKVLKSFCDILNLPFNPPGGEDGGGVPVGEEEEGEEEEDSVEFPFCFHCTNNKVLMLNMVHEKLQILQEQFAKLKDTLMKDILRTFITNIITEKKIPVEVVRQARVCERMFHREFVHENAISKRINNTFCTLMLLFLCF